MDLTKNRYKHLKYIARKKSILESDLPDDIKESVSVLLQNNYVARVGFGHSGIDFEYYEIQITEYGKMYIASRQKDGFRFWFPVIISAISLIISVLALYKSAQPINIYL